MTGLVVHGLVDTGLVDTGLVVHGLVASGRRCTRLAVHVPVWPYMYPVDTGLLIGWVRYMPYYALFGRQARTDGYA